MEIKMTFEQFQATRHYSEDIGAAIADARREGEPPEADISRRSRVSESWRGSNQ
jgi:hypothetical protein